MKLLLRTVLLLLLVHSVPVWPNAVAAEPKIRFLWPVPPGRPQLEFIGAFSSKADFPKSKWEQLLAFFAEEAPPEKIKGPSGVTSLPDGRILLADALANDIRVFDFANKDTTSLFNFPLPVFGRPGDLEADSRGYLYVVDRGKNKILAYDSHLHPLFALGAEPDFGQVEKICLNEELRRLYVSDSRSEKICVFTLEGNFLFSFGGGGSEPGQLHHPHGMAIDRAGRILVADTGNSRIQIFSADGVFLKVFHFRNDAAPLLRPWDIAVDGGENLYILDQGRAALIVCRQNGELLFSVGATGRTAHLMGFDRPTDMHLDANGRLLITDDLNGRFTVFQSLTAEYRRENPVTATDLQVLAAHIEKEKMLARAPTENKPEEDRAKPQKRKEVAVLRLLDGTAIGVQEPPTKEAKVHCPNCGGEIQLSAPEPPPPKDPLLLSGR